jgi:glutamate-5-semialdehyde dehydrogenase
MTHTSRIYDLVSAMAVKARIASRDLGVLSSETKNAVLRRIAKTIEEKKEFIQQENQKDLTAGREKGLSSAMLDRLALSDAVLQSLITGLHAVTELPDPVGEVTQMTRRPNGLMVGRMRVPLGVIAMIYESRPNVTVDAAALCLKTGNAVLLRGGSEAIHSNMALAQVLREALAAEGINPDAIQVVPITDREAVTALVAQEDSIDLVIPRGGESLIRFVSDNSKIPVLKHYKGVCHIFVDKDGDLEKAIPIILNAKTQRPGVCNALEGLLVHREIAKDFLPVIARELGRAGVQMLGCPQSVGISGQIQPAAETDWGREFLELALCVKVVADFAEAKAYIEQHGSRHTESIITENYSTAQRFINEIDASAVMVNASTRFNDGGELGLGAEIGISTTKLHAYGPMGLEELTTRKFIVYGQGQVRR